MKLSSTPIHFNTCGSLLEILSLPSARGTRQSPFCTRQRLCRVPHSAKNLSAKASLPSAKYRALGKAFAELKRKNRKKIRKKNYFNQGRAPSASTHTSPSYCIFCGIFRMKFLQLRPWGFEPATSRSRVPSSTTALHHHLCLDSILIPQILY